MNRIAGLSCSAPGPASSRCCGYNKGELRFGRWQTVPGHARVGLWNDDEEDEEMLVNAPQLLGIETVQLLGPGLEFLAWKKTVKHLGYDLWRSSSYGRDGDEECGCTSGNGPPSQQRKVARRSLKSLGQEIPRQRNPGAFAYHLYGRWTWRPGCSPWS